MSTGEKQRVTVQIFGKTYRMKGSKDTPAEYIQHLAQYVDGKMRQIAEADPRLDFPKVAVLAALTTSDQLHRTTAKLEELEKEHQAVRSNEREMTRVLSEYRQRLEEETARSKQEAQKLTDEIKQLQRINEQLLAEGKTAHG